MSHQRKGLLLTLLAVLAVFVPASPAGAAPPTVAVTSPTAGQSLGGTITLTAATSSTAILVNYYLDSTSGSVIATGDNGPAYTATWDSTAATGAHTIIAVALATTGTSAPSAPVAVTLANPVPTVRVVSPVDNALVGTNPVFTVVATPAPGGLAIDHVSYYVDTEDPSAKMATDAAPYGMQLHLATGTHTVYVFVVDTQGKASPPSVLHLTARAHTTFAQSAPPRGSSAVVGARQQLTGTLTDEDGRAVGGQTVLVEAELVGTHGYRVIRKVLTGVSGSYSAPFSLPRSARVKLVYPGSRVWQASSSGTLALAVRPAFACNGRGSKPTVLRCSSLPKLAGRVVTARFDSRVVAATTTARDGTALLRATVPAGQQISVTLRGDASYAQATSVVTVARSGSSGTGGKDCAIIVYKGNPVIVCTTTP